MTDDGAGAAGDGGSDGVDRSASDGERGGRAHTPGAQSTLSADGAYALLWGVVSLAAAALSFEGSVDLVVSLAGVAGVVGLYAVARDLRGRPPSGLEFLWMGTPALLAAGVAALEGRLLVAGGLGVVALATLVEGYGWFGAGDETRADGTDDADGEGNGEI